MKQTDKLKQRVFNSERRLHNSLSSISEYLQKKTGLVWDTEYNPADGIVVDISDQQDLTEYGDYSRIDPVNMGVDLIFKFIENNPKATEKDYLDFYTDNYWR